MAHPEVKGQWAMFDQVGFSVSSAERSIPFYEACLAPLGLRIIERQPELRAVIFAGKEEFPFLWIGEGDGFFHGVRIEVGKCPCHYAFLASSREAVHAFYRAGLAHGGRDNGAPEAGRGGYYGAFLLDPDGNNIEATFRETPAR